MKLGRFLIILGIYLAIKIPFALVSTGQQFELNTLGRIITEPDWTIILPGIAIGSIFIILGILRIRAVRKKGIDLEAELDKFVILDNKIRESNERQEHFLNMNCNDCRFFKKSENDNECLSPEQPIIERNYCLSFKGNNKTVKGKPS